MYNAVRWIACEMEVSHTKLDNMGRVDDFIARMKQSNLQTSCDL